MKRLHPFLRFGALACVLVAGLPSTHAEEIDKKFRLSFSIGNFDTSGAVHSAAANQRAIFKSNGELEDILFDPRNDSGAISNFGIESQLTGTLAASYAVSRLWYVEASVGYRTGTVGNVEVQAQFNGVTVPSTQSFNFRIFDYDGGTITQVPLEFTAGIRFRPKATFNPYLCAGFGYTIMSYAPSDEINQLSINLDQSTGGFARITGSVGAGGEQFAGATSSTNLGGIEIDVPDAPEWHVGGGFEFTVKNRWALFIDARYFTYSGNFGMTVNGTSELGVSVPNDQVFATDAGAFGPFGSVQISQGGLVDGGSLEPDPLTAPQNPPPDYCATPGAHCLLTGPPDGLPDPGYYYVQAGDVRYNGLSLQIGFKYTF